MSARIAMQTPHAWRENSSAPRGSASSWFTFRGGSNPRCDFFATRSRANLFQDDEDGVKKLVVFAQIKEIAPEMYHVSAKEEGVK